MGVPIVPALTIGLQGASSIAGGMAARVQARAERDHAVRNAYIGETRAMQTAAGIGSQLNSEMANLRVTLAANGQGINASTFPFLREMRRNFGREARVEAANERQGAADWRTQGRNSMAQGRAAMWQGILGAGPSFFRLHLLKKGPQADTDIWW